MQSGSKMVVGMVILVMLLAVVVVYLTFENANDRKEEQDHNITLTEEVN
jgi:hypothetical protein